MTEEEKFYAWLDGELEGAEADAVAARVAADPDLARLAERHRAMTANLRGAFDPVAVAPIPEHLFAATLPSGDVVDLAARRRLMPRVLPQWAAMAATLVVGVVSGAMIAGGGRSSPVASDKGRLVAAASLDEALDVQLASAPVNGPVRIGLTFRDEAGAVCRSFADAGSSGLACRDRDQWKIRGLFAAPEGQQQDYRMAAGADPNLAALIDSTIAGDALDAEQERAVQQGGWR